MLLLPPFTSGRFELILEMFSLQAETVNGHLGPLLLARQGSAAEWRRRPESANHLVRPARSLMCCYTLIMVFYNGLFSRRDVRITSCSTSSSSHIHQGNCTLFLLNFHFSLYTLHSLSLYVCVSLCLCVCVCVRMP